jgi:hypothetical protein
MDIDEAEKFAIPHAQRTAERDGAAVLESFLKSIEGHAFEHEGKTLSVKRFGQYGFDVRGELGAFDHLEFTVGNTGWGRKL